jgi:exoribonuclease-2
MFALTRKYHQYRQTNHAIFLNFPEVKIKVHQGRVNILPLPGFDSHDLVTDAMLMAGEAAARFAIEHAIPFPYTTQQPPETIEAPTTLAGMFAYRRQLKPSQIKSSPDVHAGLGLQAYSRATSPLRRYVDLVSHQQIRAVLAGRPVMDEQELMNRIGSFHAVSGSIQKLERTSNLHWTLVYLLQNPDWQGRGVIVERRERYYVVLIPEIDLEARLAIDRELALDAEVTLRVLDIDLPGLTARFGIVG